MDANIQLTIDSRLENTAPAGLAVRGIAQGFGLDETEAYLLELAVVEAVSNVIRHAYGNRPGHPVEIALALTPQGISLEILDRGTALDLGVLSRAGELAAPADISELPEGGLGLAIIKQAMDDVSYSSRDGINVLRMSKSLKLSPPREPAAHA